MADLTAADIMTADPVTIGVEASVQDAARLMTERGIGALPVVDGAGALVGLVSEGDLVMQDAKVHFPTYISFLGGYVFAPGSTERFEDALRKAVGATVGDVMTREPVTVSPSALVPDVATLVVDRGVSRVPVVDGGRLVGIISKRDIVRSLAAGE